MGLFRSDPRGNTPKYTAPAKLIPRRKSPLDSPLPTPRKPFKEGTHPGRDDKMDQVGCNRGAGHFKVSSEPFVQVGDAPWHPQGWHFAKPLGEGMSSTRLLVTLTPHNTVADRVVEKTTFIRHNWNEPWRWYGIISGHEKYLYRRVPMEWMITKLLGDRSFEVINVRRGLNAHIDPANKLTKMYLEYAEGGGDLSTVFKEHRRLMQAIPEAFLLYCFWSLLEAAKIMKVGNPKDDKEEEVGWLEVVHRDLKPGNVFLDSPDPQAFKQWPRPKLGDFGLAIMTGVEEPANPDAYNTGGGTVGYRAPEQMSWLDENDNPVNNFKMFSECNIWGIGAIMMTLMELQYPQPLRDHQRTTTDEIFHNDVYKFNDEKRWAGYNKEFYGIVEKCLHWDPDKRPTVEEALDWVHDRVATDTLSNNAYLGNDTGVVLGHKPGGDYRPGMVFIPHGLPADEVRGNDGPTVVDPGPGQRLDSDLGVWSTGARGRLDGGDDLLALQRQPGRRG